MANKKKRMNTKGRRLSEAEQRLHRLEARIEQLEARRQTRHEAAPGPKAYEGGTLLHPRPGA